MHSEDRMILNNKLSNVKITDDIYFACEQGFITSIEMQEIVNEDNYDELLVQLYKKWYKNALPEQQIIADLHGYCHLNDQFNDLKAIVGVSIVEQIKINNKINTKEEKINKINIHDEFDSYLIDFSENLEENNIFSNNNFPIYNKNDLDNNTNIVYLLNLSDINIWRVQVKTILSNLRNSNYKGRTVKDAFDWFINHIEEKKKAQENYRIQSDLIEKNEDYDDNILEVKEDCSYLANKLNLNKNKEISYAKKAIKRGFKLLSNFITSNEISLFNSGNGFVVEAEQFNYRFKKGHTDFISHTLNPLSGHIPYELIIMSKDNLELCNLCIYFDETPVIDQVVATVLHLKSGNEDELIKTGNLFNKRDAFYENEVIINKYSNFNVKIETFDKESNKIDKFSYEMFTKASNGVFNALPVFLNENLPSLVYQEFSNITFGEFFNNYMTNSKLPDIIGNEQFKIEMG